MKRVVQNSAGLSRVALIIVLLLSTVLYSQITYSLPGKQLDVSTENGTVTFTGAGTAGEPGAPLLPQYHISMVIPEHIDMSSVDYTIEDIQERVLIGTYDIKGALPPQFDTSIVWPSELTIVDGKDQAIYTNDTFYPSSYVINPGFGKYHTYKLIELTVSPYRYNPVTKQLKVITGGTLVLTDKNGKKISSSIAKARTMKSVKAASLSDKELKKHAKLKKRKKKQRKLLSEFVVNAVTLEEYSDEPAAAPMARTMSVTTSSWVPVPADTTYDYVIITTNELLSLTPKIVEFKKAKEKIGFSVLLATEEIWGGGIGDAGAENIRAFLKGNYENVGFEYVCLIGDAHPETGSVPMKMVFPRPLIRYRHYENVPTDYYYAELSGDWDLDNDGLFAEQHDEFLKPNGVDRCAELAVGRIPFYDNIADLEAILTKTIDYGFEKSEDIAWRKNVLLPMKPLSSTTMSFELGELIKDNILVPNNWNYTRVYDNQYGGNTLTDVLALSPQPEFMPCNENQVVAGWNSKEHGLVIWSTHGLAQSAHKVMTTDHIPLLNDARPVFVFQASCLNAYPENPNNLAYRMLLEKGVGTVAGTRNGYGTGSDYETAGGPNALSLVFAYNFVDAKKSIGHSLNRCKLERSGNVNNYFSYGIYGDPSLSIYSSSADTVQYSIEASVTSGSAGSGCTHPAWEPRVYASSKDTVSFEGICYRTKWYADANNRPDLGGPWENLGACETIAPVSGPAAGTIDPVGTVSVKLNRDQEFFFYPDAGKIVSGVTVDGMNLTPVPQYSYLFDTVMTNHSIAVAFGDNSNSDPVVRVSSSKHGSASHEGTNLFVRGSDITFEFTPDSASVVENVIVNGVSQGPIPSYRIASLIQNTDISVTFSRYYQVNMKFGTVNGVKNGSFKEGEVVNLEYVGVTNSYYDRYRFNGWNYGAHDAMNPITTLTMPGYDLNIYANIASLYTVTASADIGGTISPAGDTSLIFEDTTLYTFIPDEGYKVKEVLVNGTAVPFDNNQYQLTEVKGERTISVTFEPLKTAIITATSGPNGSIDPQGEKVVLVDEPITYSFLPAQGYIVDIVTVDGRVVSPINNKYLLENHSGDCRINVTFKSATLTQYTIDARSNEFGSISDEGLTPVAAGESKTYTFTPNPGYEIADVVVNGAPVPYTGNSYTIEDIQKDYTIIVYFKPAENPITFTVTPSAGTGGSISPATVTAVAAGSDVPFTFTPVDGYEVDQVLINGAVITPDSEISHTLRNITEDKTIHVTFKEIPVQKYNLDVDYGFGGGMYAAGEVVTISVNEAELEALGARFIHWYGDVAEPTNTTTTLVMPAHNYSISLNAGYVHTISASAGANGTISPIGDTVVFDDALTEFAITPDAGYVVDELLIDGAPATVPADNSYPFDSIKKDRAIHVTFKEDAVHKYALTINGGTGAGSYAAGEVISIEATPGEKERFARWSEYDVGAYAPDVTDPRTAKTTIVMPERDVNLYVSYYTLHTISATSGANGTISPSGDTLAQKNEEITYTFTPDAGYEIDLVTINGVAVTPVNNQHTVTGEMADQGIHVTFKSTTSSNYPEWESSKVYHGGDKVSYGGNDWSAKYWTQGNIPGKSDQWTKI